MCDDCRRHLRQQKTPQTFSRQNLSAMAVIAIQAQSRTIIANKIPNITIILLKPNSNLCVIKSTNNWPQFPQYRLSPGLYDQQQAHIKLFIFIASLIKRFGILLPLFYKARNSIESAQIKLQIFNASLFNGQKKRAAHFWRLQSLRLIRIIWGIFKKTFFYKLFCRHISPYWLKDRLSQKNKRRFVWKQR